MWAFIGLASFAAWVVFGVLWVIALVKKNGKAKRSFLYSAGCFVLFIVAFSADPTEPAVPADSPASLTASSETTRTAANKEPKTEVKQERVVKAVDSSPLTKQEYEELHTTPKKFKGRTVEFYAKVFTTPERDKDGVVVQAFADPKNSELNTIIVYPDPGFVVNNGDYIHVVGAVTDEFRGSNLMGGPITAPVVLADTFEITDYITAASPALKTVEVDQEIVQHGYKMQLDKVEFAEDETRVYLTITNDSKSSITFYDFNAKAVQGTKQYETAYNWEADYKEVQSDILPGVISDGIVLFEGMDVGGGDVRFFFEGRSDNWNLDFKPFEFVVGMPK